MSDTTTKLYRLTVYVCDVNDLGQKSVVDVIENNRHFTLVDVTKIEAADLGEWSDDHPVNMRGCNYEEIFESAKNA